MTTAGGRNRAREAVRQAIAEEGIKDLDDVLGDGGTEGFLAGARWPVDGEVARIEARLQWPLGTISHIVARPPLSALSGTEHAIVNMVHDMDEPDRRALLEMLKVTKMHVEQSQARLAQEHQKLDRQLRVVRGHLAD